MRQVLRVNAAPADRKVSCPHAPPPRKAGSGVNIFNLLRSIQHLCTKGGHVGLRAMSKKQEESNFAVTAGSGWFGELRISLAASKPHPLDFLL